MREVAALLAEASEIELVSHVRGDADAASVFALARALEKLGKSSSVRHDLSDHLSWLLPEAPYSSVSSGALHVAIDTGNFARLALPPEKRRQMEALIAEYGGEGGVPAEQWRRVYRVDAVIDHHATNPGYGNVNWIDTRASSVSEMLTFLILHLEERSGRELFDDEVALRLYAGIATDTNWFLRPATDRTYQAAGILETRGRIDKDSLALRLNARSTGYFWLGSVLRANAVIRGDLVSSYLDMESMQRFDVDADEAALMIEDLERTPGRLFLLFVQVGPDQIRVRLRGKGLPVRELALRFGGGGHEYRAGATVRSSGEMEQMILEAATYVNSASGPGSAAKPPQNGRGFR